MNDFIIVLNDFVHNTEKKSAGITVERKKRFEQIEHYISGGLDEDIVDFYKERKAGIEKDWNFVFPWKQPLALYLSYAKFSWSRSETVSGEGFLKGGFSFNGDPFSTDDSDFWKDGADYFEKYNPGNKTDVSLLKKLNWIESPTSPVEQAWTPYFGCVMLEKGTFPNKFYFYDSGLVYPLPFKTYEDYITAMVSAAAVECWQYFYVDTELIIEQNKDICYATWPLHTDTALGDDYKGLAPVQVADKYDRLNMIHEYMERCIRLLPGAFPFLDLSCHKEAYEQLTTLIKALSK